ncbi:MAG TPA: DUF4097 family beta strand repeat-containing protein [Pseudonocardiaceae bacterium]|jgi:hypothetical protein|nr:DUF4097 family beta strand repeat-containing protein [Pseudonocardiaceae bacterium]
MVIRGRLALVGTLLVVGGLASGCRYGFDAQDSTSTDDTTVSQSITEVRLADNSGDVTVRAGSGATTTVHRELHYNGSHKPAATTSISGGVLSLDDCGNNCSVDYTVTVPAAAKVDGDATSGEVQITGVASVDVDANSGDVTVGQIAGQVNVSTTSGGIKVSQAGRDLDARSNSGDLDINGVAGSLTSQSSSGDIVASGLRGSRSAAHSSSGDVTVEADVAQDVDAESSSGGITITVPEAAYRVVVDTNSGDKQIGVADNPSGRYTITAKSSSGDLRISTK